MTTELDVVFPGDIVPGASIRTASTDAWRASVELCGEVDIASAGALRDVLDGHLDAGRRVIRVDLHEVTFMDSTAVGVLADAHARCAKEHGTLIVTGVGGAVQRLLQITGLDDVLLIDRASQE